MLDRPGQDLGRPVELRRRKCHCGGGLSDRKTVHFKPRAFSHAEPEIVRPFLHRSQWQRHQGEILAGRQHQLAAPQPAGLDDRRLV